MTQADFLLDNSHDQVRHELARRLHAAVESAAKKMAACDETGVNLGTERWADQHSVLAEKCFLDALRVLAKTSCSPVGPPSTVLS